MSPTRCPLWLFGVLTLKPIDRCFWPFSDLAQCPLLRRCWVLSGHRGFMSTRPSVALDLKFLCELAATMTGTSNTRTDDGARHEPADASAAVGLLIRGPARARFR
jgi:hypothetical protein